MLRAGTRATGRTALPQRGSLPRCCSATAHVPHLDRHPPKSQCPKGTTAVRRPAFAATKGSAKRREKSFLVGENLTCPAKVLIYTCWRRPRHGRLGSVWGVDVPCLLKDIREERGWSLGIGWYRVVSVAS